MLKRIQRKEKAFFFKIRGLRLNEVGPKIPLFFIIISIVNFSKQFFKVRVKRVYLKSDPRK